MKHKFSSKRTVGDVLIITCRICKASIIVCNGKMTGSALNVSCVTDTEYVCVYDETGKMLNDRDSHKLQIQEFKREFHNEVHWKRTGKWSNL
jgi:hypothetical protein